MRDKMIVAAARAICVSQGGDPNDDEMFGGAMTLEDDYCAEATAALDAALKVISDEGYLVCKPKPLAWVHYNNFSLADSYVIFKNEVTPDSLWSAIIYSEMASRIGDSYSNQPDAKAACEKHNHSRIMEMLEPMGGEE